MTTVDDVTRRRARRSDAGVTKIGPRDVAALEWLGDMRVAAVPDLAVLLGRLADRAPLSDEGVRHVLDRWRAMRLVVSRRLIVGEPAMVWLTEGGAQVAGVSSVSTPAPSRLAHTAAVTRARLLVEGEGAGSWTSERAIRADRAYGATWHVPDGVCEVEGIRTAVEVELTSKTISRTAEIMAELADDQRFGAVLYFTGSPDVERIARAAVERVPEEAARRRARLPLDPRRQVEPTRAQVDQARARLAPIYVRPLPKDLRTN